MTQNELVEKAKIKLSELADSEDWEIAHQEADQVLCELLNGLGFDEVVGIYKGVGKWYC